MRIKLAIGVLGLSLATSSGLWAHHAFAAEFDAKKPIHLRGVVTKMEWINPHAWMHVDVKNPDGTVTSWMIEAGTPNTLFRRGFTKDSLKAGTEVIVGWIPGQGRIEQWEWSGCYAAGRQEAILRVYGDGCAG